MDDNIIRLVPKADKPPANLPITQADAKPLVQQFIRAELQKVMDSLTGAADQSIGLVIMESGTYRVVRLGVVSCDIYSTALREELFEMDMLKYGARQMIQDSTLGDVLGIQDLEDE